MVRPLALAFLCLAACRTTRAVQSPASGRSGVQDAGRVAAAAVAGAEEARAAKGRREAGAGAEKARAAKRGREAVVERVASLVGRRDLAGEGERVQDDCWGLVQLGYRAAGVELRGEGRPRENAVTAMHRSAQRRGALHRRRPGPGDLVFFRETYDRNGDGRRNDGLTHVGVVESVAADGTITFVHRTNSGVLRSRLNLRAPTQRLGPGGEVRNDFLRRAEHGARGRLTGELFAGYGSADALLGLTRAPPRAPAQARGAGKVAPAGSRPGPHRRR